MNFLRKTKAERRTRKSIFSGTSALISAAAAAALLPQAALAQTQPVPDQSQPGATEQAEEEEDDEAITVTGTRIRSEFNSSSPLQVITTEAATLSGANDAGEIIQNSSVAAGSPQVDATISSAFVTDGGPGAQTISLRGLGANRTLVLLNGRRAGPAGTRGSVSAFDLNVVPVGVIDRIEILKDGASSIYGSDAVAGVVNIITGRDLDGGDATIAYSQPFEDGAAELSGEVSWGHAFPQGHINLSANYYHQEETLLGQRDYTACARDYTFDSVTGARNDRIDLRTGEFACTGHAATGLVWLYDYAYFYAEGSLQNGFGPNFIQPDPSGDIGTLLPGTVVSPANPFQAGVPNNWFQVGYDSDVQSQGLVNTFPAGEQNSSLIPDVERATIYADGAYEIGGAELYGEVLLNRRETATNGFRQVWTYLYSYDFFTHLGGPIVTDEFNPGWTGFNTISPTVTTDHFDAHQQVDYVRAVAGLRGDFGGPLGNVDWDIFIQHSVSDASYTQDVILADAVYSSDGRSNYGTVGLIQPNSIPRDTASCVGFNTPISNRPCVDVNWVAESLLLGNGFTPEEEAFLYDRETGNTEYTQTYFEGMLSGDVLEIPGGNVGAAVGFHIRRDEINDRPGPVTLAGNSWGLSSSGITRGDDTTQEVFGEVAVPVYRNGESSLDLTLSGRYTDVETSGEATTYKVGLAWQATPEWLVRLTHGTSFRAPALFELYLAGETSFPRQSALDPCIDWADALANNEITQEIADNCAFDGGPNPTGGIPDDYNGSGSSATASRSGGLGLLEPETSEATVFGIVWRPSFANLSIAVDYFEIEVNDEVSTLGAAAVVLGCYTSDDFPNDPLCTLFDRGIGPEGSEPLPPTNGAYLIETVDNSFLNINSQTNRGVDLTVQYLHELPFGDFTFNGQFTYQLEDIVELFSGTAVDTNGTNGDPEFVGNLDFQLERGDWTFFWRTNLIGRSSDTNFVVAGDGAGTNYDIVAEFTDYHAASITRDADDWRLTLGVANIFDQEPPRVSTVGAAGQSFVGNSLLASQYDYVGRRVFARITRSF